MPVRSTPEPDLKAACSVTDMCKLLDLSRARFYDLVNDGVFLSPAYSVRTKRPFFTRDMQVRNLAVRATNIGVNGEYILFYGKRVVEPHHDRPQRRRSSQSSNSSLIDDLIAGLHSLGMRSVSQSQVGEALTAIFPGGVGDASSSDVLRVIFQHLRRSGAA